MSIQSTKQNRRDRLAALVDQHTQSQVAFRTGLAPSFLYQMTKGQGTNARGCSDENARLIESAMGLPPGWLDRIELEGTATPTSNAVSVMRAAISDIETPQDYVRLPHYSATVSAGHGAVIDAEGFEIVREIEIARAWAESHLPRDLSRIRVLGVRGDSMAPDLQDGDLCFVDTGRKWDGPGVYVMNWNGAAIVKRLIPEIATGRLAIVSSNPAYPVEHVGPDQLESLHIGWRVVAAWTLKKL